MARHMTPSSKKDSCPYATLISYAGEGWLDKRIQAEFEKDTAATNLTDYTARRIAAIREHIPTCQTCQRTKAYVEETGSIFKETQRDPRIFTPSPPSPPSASAMPQE